MALSVTVDESKVEGGVPKLVIHDDGMVILVHDWGDGSVHFEGSVLNTGNRDVTYYVGYHSTEWSRALFKPFYGKITLEQTS